MVRALLLHKMHGCKRGYSMTGHEQEKQPMEGNKKLKKAEYRYRGFQLRWWRQNL